MFLFVLIIWVFVVVFGLVLLKWKFSVRYGFFLVDIGRFLEKLCLYVEVFIIGVIYGVWCLLLIAFFRLICKFRLERRWMFIYMEVEVVEDVVIDGRIFFCEWVSWISDGRWLFIYFVEYRIVLYFFLRVSIYF